MGIRWQDIILDPAGHGRGPQGNIGERWGSLCASNDHHPNHIGNSGLRIKTHLASCDFRTGPISPWSGSDPYFRASDSGVGTICAGLTRILEPYRTINNKNPPLRIFGRRISPEVFIILQKSWEILKRFLLFSKKFRLRRAFIIIIFFWRPNLGASGVTFLTKSAFLP